MRVREIRMLAWGIGLLLVALCAWFAAATSSLQWGRP